MRVVHHKPQRSTGTERGLRSWGTCRSIPATADHLQDWPRKRAGLVTSNCSRTWAGLRARPTFHHFDFRAQPRWQAFVYAPKRHFVGPHRLVLSAPTLTRDRHDQIHEVSKSGAYHDH